MERRERVTHPVSWLRDVGEMLQQAKICGGALRGARLDGFLAARVVAWADYLGWWFWALNAVTHGLTVAEQTA